MLDDAPLLRRTLSLNAAFSALCGGGFLLAREPLAAWLGLSQASVLAGIGALLLAFAAHLTWASRRRMPLAEALYFIVSDALWVLGTAVILVAFPAELSAVGRAAALAVAAVVGTFAVLQSLGVRQVRSPAG